MTLTKKERRERELRAARRGEVEAWWALISRVLAFIGGVVLITNDAFLQQSSPSEVRLAFLFAGVAMTGPVVATSLAEIFSAFRGGSAAS